MAAFAPATFGRVFLVQSVIALLTAAAAVWFISTAWFPTIRAAIQQLPEQGVIRHGLLILPRSSPEPLAVGRPFLAVVVNLNKGTANYGADLSVEFHWNYVQFCSLLGYLTLRYPKEEVQFNRPELVSWWGAWEPMLQGIMAVAVTLGLMAIWAALATLYFIAVRIGAYLADRELGWGGSWRLAGVALMPGALLMTGAIWLYGLTVLDLIHLLVLAGVHLPLGWLYLVLAVRARPKVAIAVPAAANPFAAGPQT